MTLTLGSVMQTSTEHNHKKSPALRRGRPKAEVTASLRSITKQDWERLVSATVLAQINQEYSVFMRVSYLLEFPEGFPAFRIVEKDGYENIVKFRTKVLMRWLIENGHTTLTMWDIQQAGRKFTMAMKELLGEDLADDETEDCSL